MHEKQDPVLARQPGGVGVNRWAWHPTLECTGCVALANLLATGKSMPLSHLFSPDHVIFFSHSSELVLKQSTIWNKTKRFI